MFPPPRFFFQTCLNHVISYRNSEYTQARIVFFFLIPFKQRLLLNFLYRSKHSSGGRLPLRFKGQRLNKYLYLRQKSVPKDPAGSYFLNMMRQGLAVLLLSSVLSFPFTSRCLKHNEKSLKVPYYTHSRIFIFHPRRQWSSLA